MRPDVCRSIFFVSLSVFCGCFADLKEMCELLGIEQSVLERAFSYRTVEAKMEKVSTTLNVAQVRDRLASLSPLSPAYYTHTRAHTHAHARDHNA